MSKTTLRKELEKIRKPQYRADTLDRITFGKNEIRWEALANVLYHMICLAPTYTMDDEFPALAPTYTMDDEFPALDSAPQPERE